MSASHSQTAALAAKSFHEKGSYLSHPEVRPFLGLNNGDSIEAWEKDYWIAFANAVLKAAKSDGPAERALKLCRDIQRIYENYGRNAEAEGAAACCNAIAEAYKSAATSDDGGKK